MLSHLAPDLFVFDQPLRFLGVELGSRMTVLRFGEALLLHSPVRATPALRTAVEALGEVRWVVAPNRFHHLSCGDWLGPGVSLLGVPGLGAKRPDLDFHGLIDESTPLPEGLTALALRSLPLVSETVLHHAPSRTLVVTDLAFHISPEAPWLTRAAMRLAGGYPGLRATALERVFMQRALAREELGRILSWDFEGVVLAHGEVVHTDGRARLAEAYAWLDLPQLTGPA